MRVRRNLWCAIVLLVLGSMSQVASACVATYTDSYVDTEQAEVHAWAWVEDTFNTGYCFQAAFAQWGAWSHTYQASVEIESPTQNFTDDVGMQYNVSYGGGSTSAYSAISYIGDLGEYQINYLMQILCTIGGLFFHFTPQQLVTTLPACTESGIEHVVKVVMWSWSPLAWERGGVVLCLDGFAIPFYLRDSFGEIYDDEQWNYEPTEDPCTLNLIDPSGTVAGFHSHPLFTNNNQLNEGEGCHGEGPYQLSVADINLFFNIPNQYFAGDDFDWPQETDTPLYLLVPGAHTIRRLNTNLQTHTVWP